MEPEAELRREDLAADPLEQFRQWFAGAVEALEVPEAMALATAAHDGAPSVRMVLLKGFDPRGLVFFSHYTSRKGLELVANPQAALLFHWSPLGRQVRVEGRVERLPEAESDAYFATRPRESQIGAWASKQSASLAAPASLDERIRNVRERFEGAPVPRPPFWSGFRVVARSIEFWTRDPARLHERVLFQRSNGQWERSLLFP